MVKSDADDMAGIYPMLMPNKADTRTKSKRQTPLGLDELAKFVSDLREVQEKIGELIERLAPIYMEPARKLVAKIKHLEEKAKGRES